MKLEISILLFKVVAQGISQKLMTFSRNWGIRLVFTKDRHHAWQQECFFCYNPQNAAKCRPGKEIFQSMILYNTNKSPMRNIFFFVYHKLGWDMEQK